MLFTLITVLLLTTLPLALITGYLFFTLACNGLGVSTYPNPDSK